MSITINDGQPINRWNYMSAYAIAVKHGYKGTEAEWLEAVYGGAASARADAEAAAEAREVAVSSASDSEAWATGKRGGEDVPDTDPAYHNNAAYYSGQASDSADAAAASKAAAKGYADSIADPVSGIVTSWLDDHEIVVDPENYVVDNSLTTAGAAADAAACGDLRTQLRHTYSDLVTLKTTKTLGGIKDEDGDVSVTSTTGYYYAQIAVEEGMEYVVSARESDSATYPYYAFLTDEDAHIMKSLLPGGQNVVVTDSVVASSGSAHLYVMAKRDTTLTVKRRDARFLEKDAAEGLYLSLKHDETPVKVTKTTGGVQNSDGSVTITESTGYYYAVVPCEKGEKYKLEASQNHTSAASMSNYPYYAFVVNEDLEILESLLAVDTSITTGYVKVTQSVEITDDAAKKIYIMATRDLALNVALYTPYWTNKINEIDEYINPIIPDDTGLALLDAARYSVLEHNQSEKFLNFSFITDTHFNGGISGTVVSADKNMKLFCTLANEKWLDFAVHNGDMFSAYNMTDEAFFKVIDTVTQVFGAIQIPFYWTKGNHEVNIKNGSQNEVSNSQWYILAQNRLRGLVSVNSADPYAGYFYTDINGVRIIDVNFYLNYAGSSEEHRGMSIAERAFIENALNTANGMPVVVFMHPPIETTGNGVYELLHAFISGGGTVAAVIHGHTHTDDYSNEFGFNLIGVQRGFAQVPGEIGTSDEYCFSVFTVDTTTQRIYETRIGRGSDRVFSYDVPAEITGE